MIYKLSIYIIIISISTNLSALSGDESDLTALSLQELLNVKVYTATKSELGINQVPASITVINQSDIKRFGYANVAEIINHVAGFSSTNNLVYEDFGVRGSHAGVRAASRIMKVLVNGKPITFRSSSQNFLGDSLFSLSIVDRIEIIRGPASALYGANAFLGVINIVTTQSPDFNSHRGSVSYYNYQLSEDGLAVNGSTQFNSENYQLLIDLSFKRLQRGGLELPKISPEASSFYANENNLHAKSRDNNSTPMNFFATWQYQHKRHKIGLQAFRQIINSDNPFSDLNPLRDTGYNQFHIINQHLSLDHEYTINNQHQLRSQLIWSDGDTGDDDRIELGADDHYLKRRSGFDALDLQFELSSDWNHLGHTLIGVDHTNEDFSLETFYRVERESGDITSLMPADSAKVDNTGLYFQWQKSVSESVDTIFGLRRDNSSISDKQNSVRLGFVWLFQPNLSLKLLAGNSFQAPSVELLYRNAVQAGDIIGNHNLASQKAKTIELIMDWSLSNSWKINMTGFQTKVDDLVVYQTDFTNLFAKNSSTSHSKGIEVEIKYQKNNWHNYANFSYHQMDITPSQTSLFFLEQREDGEIFPQKMLNVGMSYLFKEQQVTASLEYQYASERPASSQNILIAQKFYQLDSHQDTSLYVRKELNQFFDHGRARLGLKIRNLFNNQYVNPGFGGIDYPNLGRRYQLTFEWLF